MVRVFALIGFGFMAAGAWAGPFQDRVPQVGPAARGTPATMPAAELSAAEKRLREEDERIYAMLDEIVPEARFEQTPLHQVLQWFGDLTQVSVQVDWQDLEDNAIDRTKPVTLTLRNLPRRRVLRRILEGAGGETRLDYEACDGVLHIATKDRLDQDRIVRVYPVRDLLTALTAWLQRQRTPAEPRAEGGISAADLAKATDAEYREELARRSMTTQPKPLPRPVDEALVAEVEKELKELLRQTIEPDSWRENGGEATARIYNGVLVVYQNRRAHREIERLLADLRAAGAADTPAAKPALPQSSGGSPR